MEKLMTNCKHCGRAIDGYSHILDSGHRGKGRCDPDESGLPYGYNAEPEGQPCSHPCLGARGKYDHD